MFELFTDGGCYPNPGGPGAHAWVITRGGRPWGQGVQTSAATTNNREELLAVIRGLSEVPEGAAVTLYSDSQYVTKGLTEWRAAWERAGWRNPNGDLWRELAALADARVLTVEWVRGHSGHPENELCDAMVTAAYRGK